MEELAEDTPPVIQTKRRGKWNDYIITISKLKQRTTKQILFVILWVFVAIFIMNIFNAYVYSRMPIDRPVPDIIEDTFSNFANLRGNSLYMKFQPGDMMCLVLAAMAIGATIVYFERINMRKFGIVYCVSIHLRTLLFTVTGLPPACIGYPRCPCAVVPYGQVGRDYSIPKMAVIYTMSAGLFLNRFPQCGDLTMSGHTVFLWSISLYFLETLEKVIPATAFKVLKVIVYGMVIGATLLIILIRNHYSIDIVMATMFTNLIWTGYTWCQYLLRMEYLPFANSKVGQFLAWIESVSFMENN